MKIVLITYWNVQYTAVSVVTSILIGLLRSFRDGCVRPRGPFGRGPMVFNGTASVLDLGPQFAPWCHYAGLGLN